VIWSEFDEIDRVGQQLPIVTEGAGFSRIAAGAFNS
jgi:hypothetical protein